MEQRVTKKPQVDVDSLQDHELARLVSGCLYCERIDYAVQNIPVLCTKFSGSRQPIRVNFNTCIACGEFL